MSEKDPQIEKALYFFGTAMSIMCLITGAATIEAVRSGDYSSLCLYWGAVLALTAASGVYFKNNS